MPRCSRDCAAIGLLPILGLARIFNPRDGANHNASMPAQIYSKINQIWQIKVAPILLAVFEAIVNGRLGFLGLIIAGLLADLPGIFENSSFDTASLTPVTVLPAVECNEML